MRYKLAWVVLLIGLQLLHVGCARTSTVGDGRATANYAYGRCTVTLSEISLAVGTHEWRLKDVPNSSMCLGIELPSRQPVPAGCIIRYSLLSESGNVLSTWLDELPDASGASKEWWIISGDWMWMGRRPQVNFEFGRPYTLRLEVLRSTPEHERLIVIPMMYGFLDS